MVCPDGTRGTSDRCEAVVKEVLTKFRPLTFHEFNSVSLNIDLLSSYGVCFFGNHAEDCNMRKYHTARRESRIFSLL